MAGTNHHHIPRFLQRGFAVDGDKHKIWRFDKNGAPPTKPRSISRTGSEDNFYSAELDELITGNEISISNALIALRSEGIGAAVDANVAAQLVFHLAPRTAHWRQTMERGLRQIIIGSELLFNKREKLEAMIGLSEQAPNATFDEHFDKLFDEHAIFAVLAVPRHVIRRVAFYLAKEQFETNAAQIMPMFGQLFMQWREKAGEVARAGHIKALSTTGEAAPRLDDLASLDWKLIAGPEEGAILPDCVALALDQGGRGAPLMLIGLDELEAVIMPISSAKLLVGTRPGRVLASDFGFNVEAARSSHRYFMAAADDDRIVGLQQFIDERATDLIDETVNSAIKDFATESAPAESPNNDSPSPPERQGPATATDATFGLSLPSYDEPEYALELTEAIRSIVSSLAATLPLSRLEGITVAADYAAALGAVDRGVPGISSPTTIDPKIAIGIAQSVIVLRDGVVKCHVVIDHQVGAALVSDDAKLAEWALGVLVRQLAIVSLVDIFDTRLPGTLLTPIADPLHAALCPVLGGAADSYMASHLCAGFGQPMELITDYASLLADAVKRARSTIPAARLEYRRHGSVDVLLDAAVPLLNQILSFAATLLGTCEALGVEPAEAGSELDTSLQGAGLAAWLKWYHADLEAIRTRLGIWNSFDEFLALDVHVERLMWQFGMMPWADGGHVRVEIPLATDAVELGLA